MPWVVTIVMYITTVQATDLRTSETRGGGQAGGMRREWKESSLMSFFMIRYTKKI